MRPCLWGGGAVFFFLFCLRFTCPLAGQMEGKVRYVTRNPSQFSILLVRCFFEENFMLNVWPATFLGGSGAGGLKLERRKKCCPEASVPAQLPPHSASPCSNRLNSWIMASCGLKYTHITYPFLTNQPDTFLCW